VKPANPAALPFEVRALWLAPFNSPSLYRFLYSFFPLIILAIVSFCFKVKSAISKKLDSGQAFIAYNALVFLFIYLLIQRMQVFFTFFLIVLVGYFINMLRRFSPRYFKMGVMMVLLCLFLEFHKVTTYGEPNIFSKSLHSFGVYGKSNDYRFIYLNDVGRELIEWIKKDTKPDDVILTKINISAMVRGYADRAVNLTSLYESKFIRKKVEKYMNALFSSEEELYQICQQWKADYVVYTADTIIDDSVYSVRYLANNLSLKEGSVAYKMHFFPEKLKRFNLVFENDYCRVYKVISQKVRKQNFGKITFSPLIYNHEVFKKFSGSTSKFKEYVQAVNIFYIVGNQYFVSGNYEKAVKAYTKAIELAPDFLEGYLGLGRAYEKLGDLNRPEYYHNKYLGLKQRALPKQEKKTGI